MTRRVVVCDNSTIAEAWMVMRGQPAPLDETEPAALQRFASLKLPKLDPVPTLVVQSMRSGATESFWKQQVAWDGGRYQARFGHRYLSVHFIRQGEQRYHRYGTTLASHIEPWLTSYATIIPDVQEADYALDSIAFGYVNSFDISDEAFDVEEYFKLSLAVGLQADRYTREGAKASFQLFDKQRSARVEFQLQADTPMIANGPITVRTTLLAEQRAAEGRSMRDTTYVQDAIDACRQAAKDAFFGFMTDKTLQLMGTQYAQQ